MKRLRLAGLGLMAILALSAVASATASATLPEFSPASGVTLKGKAVGNAILETKSGTKVKCTGGSSGGEVTAEKTVSKVKIIFTGCESSGFKCKTPGAASGELVTEELTGTLGYISKAGKEVGILFKPTSGTKFIEFECVGGIVKTQVTGSVICPIKPVNTKTTKFTLLCKQTKGVQSPLKFEGLAEESLKTSINGGTPEQSGEEAEASIETSKEMTIVA
jgi:hypothetical protein